MHGTTKFPNKKPRGRRNYQKQKIKTNDNRVTP